MHARMYVPRIGHHASSYVCTYQNPFAAQVSDYHFNFIHRGHDGFVALGREKRQNPTKHAYIKIKKLTKSTQTLTPRSRRTIISDETEAPWSSFLRCAAGGSCPAI